MGHDWFIKIKGTDARWNCLANGAYVPFFCFSYRFLFLLLCTFNASQYKVLLKPVKHPAQQLRSHVCTFICLCVCLCLCVSACTCVGCFFLFSDACFF